MSALILTAENGYAGLDEYICDNHFQRIFLVCGKSIDKLQIGKYFEGMEKRLEVKVVKFSNFTPNPQYESVVEGIKSFNQAKCDAIFAVGGGSAIDVAKCIKLFANMDPAHNYLNQDIIVNRIPLFAMPTTAGTGSEATRFAVIYYKGEKQSVTHESCIPSAVLFDPAVLLFLPDYQKKATMLDALCHAVEAYWSVNSTDESKMFSKSAIELILSNAFPYLQNDLQASENMLRASYLAGRAINITQTTAGHAMCYKLTSIYGLAHGHAAGWCVYYLWPFMLEHTEECIDPRGREYLEEMFKELSQIMGGKSITDGYQVYQNFFDEMHLERPVSKNENEFDLLKKSVNPDRLKNNPVKLTEESIDKLYHLICTRF